MDHQLAAVVDLDAGFRVRDHLLAVVPDLDGSDIDGLPGQQCRLAAARSFMGDCGRGDTQHGHHENEYDLLPFHDLSLLLLRAHSN